MAEVHDTRETTHDTGDSRPTSLIDPLLPWVHENPDAIAVRTPPGENRVELTRGRFLAEIAAARDRFAADGLEPGDRIVLVAPTTPEFLIEFLGANTAGLAVVTVNPLSTARELDYLLEDSGARLLVSYPGMSDAGRTAAADRGVAFRQLSPVSAAGPELRPDADGSVSFGPKHTSAWDDLAALLYTSGTTGKPKGAMLSLGNFVSASQIVGEMVDFSGDGAATGLPLFHVFGLASVSLPALANGSPLTLFPRWDPAAFVNALEQDDVAIVSGVPTMWMSVLAGGGDAAAPSEPAAPSLRAVVSGGASIAGEVIRQVEQRLAAPVTEGYGLTETTAMGTFNPLHGTRKIGSVGPAIPRTQIKIVDSTGATVPTGEVGEIAVHGPTVMLGYWQKPEATAQVLDTDGWFRTGDLGRLDADGYLYIVDRIKDLIIHGGYNVYPREVEEVLYEIPGVAQVAVVGTPDEKYGQQVTAVITRAPGAEVDAAQVEAVSRENLAAYKIPRIIEFVDELPMGPSGKILKREIVRKRAEDAEAAGG